MQEKAMIIIFISSFYNGKELQQVWLFYHFADEVSQT